jgi:hypothetical protein
VKIFTYLEGRFMNSREVRNKNRYEILGSHGGVKIVVFLDVTPCNFVNGF